nr:DedA family protein [Propionibacteriales bacterium]
AAIVGDSVGYEIGRQVGVRVLEMRIFDAHRGRLNDAQRFLARRGGSAVFLGRWVAFFRAVMPALAGTARMRYPTFLAYNAAGGLVWGVAVVLVGYFAGESYAKVEQTVGRGVAVAIAGIVLLAFVVWRVRKHSSDRSRTRPPQQVTQES